MSTIQERLGTVDRSTVTEFAVDFASFVGRLVLMASAAFIYALFVVVAHEALADAGVLAELTPTATVAFRALLNIPIIAALGWTSTRAVSIIFDRDYSASRGAVVVVGGYALATYAHLSLISYGVL